MKNIRKDLREHYRDLLIKKNNFEWGDDESEISTKENELCQALFVILNDLEQKQLVEQECGTPYYEL